MPKTSKLGITCSQYQNKAEYQRQWRALNPEKVEKYESSRCPEKTREAAWSRRYGITRNDYENMLKEQKGCCKICGSSEVGRGHRYFHVDHNHETGIVRGLLCDLCNRGLGYFRDSPKILTHAANYLRGVPCE